MKKNHIGLIIIYFSVIFQNICLANNTYYIGNLNDSGTQSLRQAIIDANASGNPANIYLIPGTINLFSALPISTVAISILYPMGTIINNSVGLSTPVFPYSGAGSITIPDR